MVRVVLVVLVLVSVAFAGCTSTPDDATDNDAETPVLHTSPRDTANQSADDGQRRAHLHDYWGGVREFLVFDETVWSQCTACGSGAPLVRYEPPGGAVFPQGTRWVNVTVSWEDDATASYANPTLWVETASDHAPWEVGPVENGDTVHLEVSETASDLPHELLSNWAFEIRVTPDDPNVLWRREGEVSISAVAARGHPIELFPAHPDLWDGAREIALFAIEDAAEPVYRGNPETGQTGNNWLGPYGPDSGLVVPYDAAMVTVEVDYDADAIVPFTLGFHGADTREWTLIEPTDESAGQARYDIPLTQGLPDGPYARQSHWLFEVWADAEDPDLFMGGFTISATVHRDLV